MIYGTTGTVTLSAGAIPETRLKGIIIRLNGLLNTLSDNVYRVESASDKLVAKSDALSNKSNVEDLACSGHLYELDKIGDRLVGYNNKLESATDELHSYL